MGRLFGRPQPELKAYKWGGTGNDTLAPLGEPDAPLNPAEQAKVLRKGWYAVHVLDTMTWQAYYSVWRHPRRWQKQVDGFRLNISGKSINEDRRAVMEELRRRDRRARNIIF